MTNVLTRRLAAQAVVAAPKEGGHPLSSDKPELCAVCRRHAVPLGHRPAPHLPLIWTCGNSVCNLMLARIYGMADEKLDALEEKAANAAGDKAGQWLDSIGKTDLAELTPQEWAEFLGHIVLGFQAELRELIKTDAVPF